jgi:uncharacterized membrane protein YqjE
MNREIRIEKNDGRIRTTDVGHDASLTDLLKRLGTETGDLVRSEIALARIEMTQTARQMAMDSVKLVVAAAVAWIGVLALTAALIAGLTLVVGSVWASALIVGVIFLAIGGILAQRGIAGMKENSLKPEATAQSLQRDKRWAQHEARDFREGIRS